MPREIEIDLAALKSDYEEGAAWPELVMKFGASKSAILKRLKTLGVRLRGRGRRPGSGNGHMPRSVGDRMAKLSARRAKAQRPAAKAAAKGENRWAETIADLILQRDSLQAAIDALSDLRF